MMLYECGIRYERTMPNGMSKKVTQHMKTSFVDYEIATLDETKIMDLFRYMVNTTSSNG